MVYIVAWCFLIDKYEANSCCFNTTCIVGLHTLSFAANTLLSTSLSQLAMQHTDVEVDMNQELIAHGYSNMLSGMFGGLQNYMAYTQSVIYDKSGGTGKASGYSVAALTIVLYFIGPTVASYIPRCMAGTLLLHVGIDLFLEGAYDSLFKFDRLEYASVMIM